VGEKIPIEERNPIEITQSFGKPTEPAGVRVYNPAFDVTPAELISGIVTEEGVVSAPFGPGLAGAVASAKERWAATRPPIAPAPAADTAPAAEAASPAEVAG
jgi:hypothetical protein